MPNDIKVFGSKKTQGLQYHQNYNFLNDVLFNVKQDSCTFQGHKSKYMYSSAYATEREGLLICKNNQ